MKDEKAGFHIRHAKGITFEIVRLICEKDDYRTAVVLDDAHKAIFRGLQVSEPGDKKMSVFSYRSTEIDTEK